jgi:hypothetical protein
VTHRPSSRLPGRGHRWRSPRDRVDEDWEEPKEDPFDIDKDWEDPQQDPFDNDKIEIDKV